MEEEIELRKNQQELINKLRKRSISRAGLGYAVVLLLDISGSMTGKKLEDAKEALVHFLKNIDLIGNEVGLIAFGGSVNTVEMSQDYLDLETEIRNFKAGGGTPLYRAIQSAYKKLLMYKTKPVMVIATDGQPTDAPEYMILDYASSIKGRGFWVITIRIGEDANESFLKNLSSSVNDYHFAKDSIALKSIFQNISDVLSLPHHKRDYHDKI
jgi:Ca-activated chloride channel family protein